MNKTNDDWWYVVYETYYDTETQNEVCTQFVGGFIEKKDAKAFLKLQKRKYADTIKRGWRTFFIEKRPLFR